MKIVRRLGPFLIITVIILLSMLRNAQSLAQASQNEPAILIGQVKITSSNGQFITLYNNSSDTIDMSTVQLAYYNSYDLTKATSSKFIGLSGKLSPGNYYLVSDGALFVCYKMTVNALSLGFSSTAGMVQVMKLSQSSPGGLVTTGLVDSVAWSKTAAAGAQTLPSLATDFLQRVWVDSVLKTPGGGAWLTVHPASDACDLQVQLATSTTPAAPEPPKVLPYKTVATTVDSPAATLYNIGLVAPEITEIFPNPAPPANDDTDEFIELYNPNDSPFNLSGYRLEAGTSYSRGFTFKDSVLQPKSYTALYITDSNLQLSNSEGQVRLLAPDSTVLSETPGYENAPEGSSWGIVKDNWQWLETPTPNAANKANSVDSSTDTTKASAKKTTGKVAGASTTTPSSSAPVQLDDAAPLHPLVLAGIGAAAVAYAVYEYRKDLANRIFQARRYFRNRRAVRARL